MVNMFCVTKSERTRLRKLPLLPRIGITVDVAGRQFTYKYAPVLETLLLARERGFSMKNILKVANEQLAEIAFPAVAKRALSVVKDAAAAVTAEPAGEKQAAAAQKKAPAKAAAAKKKKTAKKAPAKDQAPTA